MERTPRFFAGLFVVARCRIEVVSIRVWNQKDLSLKQWAIEGVRSRYSIEEKSPNLSGAWFRVGGMQRDFFGHKIFKHNGEHLSHV